MLQLVLASVLSVFVLDGDTVAVGDERIRLIGIDACEIGQHILTTGADCGEMSKRHLQELVAQGVTISRDGTDRYGRTLAVLINQSGNDLNLQMVLDGYAIAYRHYGKATVPAYLVAELQAQAEHVGLWKFGEHPDPRKYRDQTQNLFGEGVLICSIN